MMSPLLACSPLFNPLTHFYALANSSQHAFGTIVYVCVGVSFAGTASMTPSGPLSAALQRAHDELRTHRSSAAQSATVNSAFQVSHDF
jgi:hypothetical protein